MMAVPRRRIPIPCLIASSQVRGVMGALERSRFELVPGSSWREIVEIAPLHSPCVVGVDGPDDVAALTAIKGMRLQRSDLGVLVLAEGYGDGAQGAGENAPGASFPPGVDVLVSPCRTRGLLARLAAAWIGGRSARLRQRVSAARHLPFTLRAFLREVLGIRLLREEPDGGWSVSPRVVSLCNDAGLTPSRLYSDARAWEVRPAKVIDAWRVVLIVAVRDLEGLPWKEIETMAGYESSAGFSKLLLRGLGQTTAAVHPIDASYWVRWFEDEVLGRLPLDVLPPKEGTTGNP